MINIRIAILLMALGLSGCDALDSLTAGTDATFGDQHFKSAISAIELHKIRNGSYPETLRDLEYLGEWDEIWMNAVKYEKVAGGYNLYVARGWISPPDLIYPEPFFRGLGLVETNVAKSTN